MLIIIRIFYTLYDFESGAALSDHLKKSSRLYQGTAIREVLKILTKDKERHLQTVSENKKRFKDQLKNDFLLTGQLERVADKFALVAAVGQWLIEQKIVNWEAESVYKACKTLLAAYIKARGGTAPFELLQAEKRLSELINGYGNSRFQVMGSNYPDSAPTDKPIHKRAGFRKKNGDRWEYYLFPETFKDEICGGANVKDVMVCLKEKGVLKPDSQNKSMTSTPTPEGQKRLYRIVLNADTESEAV